MSAAFTEKTRRIVHTRDGWCVGCGSHHSLQLQHRRARGAGGTRQESSRATSNAVVLCATCHAWCERKPTFAAFLGWRVAQFEDPTKVPCWRGTGLADGNWYLLDDNGDVTIAPDALVVAQASSHAQELTRAAA